LDVIIEHRAADVFPAVARLAEAGIDFGGFLTGLADMLRAQLSVALGGVATEVSERAREALATRRDRIAAADLLRMLQAIAELEPLFRKSWQQQLLVETMLVRFALLDRAVQLEDVLRSLGGAAPSPTPSPRDTNVRIGGSSSVGAGSPPPATRQEPRVAPRADLGGRPEAQLAAPVP